MKSKLTKIIALAMALTLVASFAACGKKGEEETTAPETTTEAVLTPDETQGEVPSDDTTAAENTTVAETNNGETSATTNKQPVSDPKKPSQPNNNTPGTKLPEGKDALIAAYNNGLGAMKGSQKRSLKSGKIDAGEIGTLDFGSNEEGKKVVEGRDPNTKISPVAAPAKLNAGSVASAAAKGTADNYTITFKLNPLSKTMTQIKKGDGGYMHFIDQAEMQSMIPGIIKAAGLKGNATILGDESKISLSNGTYTVTVQNGQVTKAVLSFKEVVSAKAKYLLVKPYANVDIDMTVTYTK